MKSAVYVLTLAGLLCSFPAVAQGPFTDVPTDHWAYEAVNKLQRDGILIGFPDGTYGGKRAITRYEFAAAIARIVIPAMADLSDLATKKEVEEMARGYVKKSDLPDFSKFATKDDLAALRKLLDEFKDEIAALGVDIDAMKGQLDALSCRVAALENEHSRVRFTGNFDAFAIADSNRQGFDALVPAVDRDERTIPADATLGRTIGVVRDFDLNVVGRVTNAVTASSTINFGNYLNYLRFVDDYVDGVRPTSKSDSQGAIFSKPGLLVDDKGFSDEFFPYFMYGTVCFCKGKITAGRFPLQFTPYSLKKIDVDSYTSIFKTDSGDYPVDGIRLDVNTWGVDWTWYAAKHDQNDYLIHGLTGQPNSGLFNNIVSPAGGRTAAGAPFNEVGGHAVGGLQYPISQSAGAMARANLPFKVAANLIFYQAWSRDAFDNELLTSYDQARVFGGNLTVPFFSHVDFAGTYLRSDALRREGSAAANVNRDNMAWDGRLGAGIGRLSIDAGYKHIGRNYAAAGAWDKIGRWTNPTNVKGPYIDLGYPIAGNLRFIANGEYLKMIDSLVADTPGPTDLFVDKNDKVIKAEGGLRWGLSKCNSVDLGYEYVKYEPMTGESRQESYINVGLACQFSPNAGCKIGYQFINYYGAPSGVAGLNTIGYGADGYRGGLGVVQLGVAF